MPEITLTQYLRINHPYIWRTRVYIYLPLFLTTSIFCCLLNINREFTLSDFPAFDKIQSEVALIRLCLIPISMVWLIQLWRFPLQNPGKIRLCQAFLLYLACMLTADFGPRYYAHAQIMAINRIEEVSKITLNELIQSFSCLCSSDEPECESIVDNVLSRYRNRVRLKWNKDLSDWFYKTCQQADYTNISESKFESWLNQMQLIEVKKYAQHQPSVVDNLRLSTLSSYLYPLLLALFLLIFSTKNVIEQISRLIDTIKSVFRIPIESNILRFLNFTVIINRPIWWAFGLHLGLIYCIFSVLLVLFEFVLINYFYRLEIAVGSSLISFFVLTLFYFCLWVYRQSRIAILVDSFSVNFKLVLISTLLQFFFWNSLTVLLAYIYGNNLIISLSGLISLSGIYIISLSWLFWCTVILWSTRTHQMMDLVLAIMSQPVSILVLGFIFYFLFRPLYAYFIYLPFIVGLFLCIVWLILPKIYSKKAHRLSIPLLVFISFSYPLHLFTISFSVRDLNYVSLTATPIYISLLILASAVFTKMQKA